MTTVTQRVTQTKQPRGGYINPRSLDVRQLDDGKPAPLDHTAENIHASLVGLAVEYLTHLLNGTQPQVVFRPSLLGASLIGERRLADDRLHEVTGLSHRSIVNTCQLVGYDAAYRAGVEAYRPVQEIQPDATTTAHIATMVERSLAFFREYGPVTLDAFSFPGGYTDLVTAGDGDFLTADTLWEFKVSVRGPTKDHTLQLLMYWLMGRRSGQIEFDTVRHLGVFNPRLNSVYRIALAAVPAEVVEEVSRDVIGY